MQEEFNSETQINLPQDSQIQCKICYVNSVPLLRLCQCRGSIGFVHEECILKWLTVKLEQTTQFKMPCCEVCKSEYSAELRDKEDHTSLTKAMNKLLGINVWTMTILLITLLGAISLIFIEVNGARDLWSGSIENYLIWFFSYIVFPGYFVKTAMGIYLRLREEWEECRVRQAEVFLLPKEIFR